MSARSQNSKHLSKTESPSLRQYAEFLSPPKEMRPNRTSRGEQSSGSFVDNLSFEDQSKSIGDFRRRALKSRQSSIKPENRRSFLDVLETRLRQKAVISIASLVKAAVDDDSLSYYFVGGQARLKDADFGDNWGDKSISRDFDEKKVTELTDRDVDIEMDILDNASNTEMMSDIKDKQILYNKLQNRFNSPSQDSLRALLINLKTKKLGSKENTVKNNLTGDAQTSTPPQIKPQRRRQILSHASSRGDLNIENPKNNPSSQRRLMRHAFSFNPDSVSENSISAPSRKPSNFRAEFINLLRTFRILKRKALCQAFAQISQAGDASAISRDVAYIH